MIELLHALKYHPPKIQAGNFGRLKIIHDFENTRYNLLVDDQQWMSYQYQNHEEAYDVFSHYCMAQGHVLTTGLGFGIRESWILTKPEVTKLTVIERCQELIDYHRAVQSPWLQDPRVEIKLADANTYCATADVVLLDHYEFESYDQILDNMKVLQTNIACRLLWAWPMERIIMHCRKWHSDNDAPKSLLTKHQAYQLIKHNHRLHKLPDLSPQQINMFCMMFNSKMFSRSEDFLDNFWPDRQKDHAAYIHI